MKKKRELYMYWHHFYMGYAHRMLYAHEANLCFRRVMLGGRERETTSGPRPSKRRKEIKSPFSSPKRGPAGHIKPLRAVTKLFSQIIPDNA